MLLTESVLGLLLSFVVVTLATHVSSGLLTSGAGVGYSALTAGITSLVWFGITYFLSGVVEVSGVVVALGPAAAVLAYVVVIDALYEGTVVRAVAISLATWVVTFAVLYGAAAAGYGAFEALGVPPGIVSDHLSTVARACETCGPT
jgi:hypothetical protein